MHMKRILKQLTKFSDAYKEEFTLSDYLAMERTKLANERTLLSYIRSSLYLVVGGIALLQVKELQEIRFFGYFSLAISVVVLVIGIFRYLQLKKQLRKMYKSAPKNTEDHQDNSSRV